MFANTNTAYHRYRDPDNQSRIIEPLHVFFTRVINHIEGLTERPTILNLSYNEMELNALTIRFLRNVSELCPDLVNLNLSYNRLGRYHYPPDEYYDSLEDPKPFRLTELSIFFNNQAVHLNLTGNGLEHRTDDNEMQNLIYLMPRRSTLHLGQNNFERDPRPCALAATSLLSMASLSIVVSVASECSAPTTLVTGAALAMLLKKYIYNEVATEKVGTILSTARDQGITVKGLGPSQLGNSNLFFSVIKRIRGVREEGIVPERAPQKIDQDRECTQTLLAILLLLLIAYSPILLFYGATQLFGSEDDGSSISPPSPLRPGRR